MRIHDITKNDKKLAEWDPNIISWGLDALDDLTKGIRRRKDIDDYRQKADDDDSDDNTTRRIKRSGGSDDYDHLIKKHMKR